jgi:hypothetical protein
VRCYQPTAFEYLDPSRYPRPAAARPAAPPAEARPRTLHLDTVAPAACSVWYGELGTGGELGYEGQQITVQVRAWSNALSTHPPARLRWELNGAWRSFRCQVALNGDVSAGRSHADFAVYADGRRVAIGHHHH